MIRQYTADQKPCFYLGNDSLSLIIRIRFSQAELLHFGAPLLPEDAEALSCKAGTGWGCSVLYDDADPLSSLDTLPLAWSGSGIGDYRESPIELSLDGVPIVPDFVYRSARITDNSLVYHSSLPAARGECETLELTFVSASSFLGEETTLTMAFSLYDTALVRRTVLRNGCGKKLQVTKCMSSMLDLKGKFDMTAFSGAWIAEMHPHRVPVSRSRVVNESVTGFSSNFSNPGFILSRADTGEDWGEAYGFNLIWSGNHYSSAQLSEQGLTRIVQGISHDHFLVTLNDGEIFETPEAVLSFSAKGFNGLSDRMHRFINRHIIPEAWQYKERPVIYNDWEGCMFDFDEAKLLSLARKAKKLGCELFVLDDGWFGARNDDHAGLGDYNVNRTKLPNGLDGLSQKIHEIGLDFGLWFEPEAVNEDSDLYRTHPDWALRNAGVRDIHGRNELLLDLTNPAVRDYIVASVSGILDSAEINYAKWDMNRHSIALGAKAYAYILGLYDVLHRIFDSRPHILLEGCASGGNRFDLGMLCFAPQIWASDDTDPIERIDIQNGLSYLYPQSTVGAHVSADPHAQTLRATPMSTRANVAFFGAFGLEFDLAHLLPVEEAELKSTIAWFVAHRETFQFGTFRRNRAEDGAVSWQVTGEKETLVALFHRLIPASPGHEWLYASSLCPGSVYQVESRPQALRVGRFGGLLKHITPIELDPNGIVLRTADRHHKMMDGADSFRCSGSALEAGVPLAQRFSGAGYQESLRVQGDFLSNIYRIRLAEEKKKKSIVRSKRPAE